MKKSYIKEVVFILVGIYLIASGMGVPIPVPPVSVMVGGILVLMGVRGLSSESPKAVSSE